MTTTLSLDSFTTFGALLKYLRQRQRLTQRELGLAVGYGDAQINRLEHNLRLPDVGVVVAQFIPALHLEDEPLVAARLVELAAQAVANRFRPPSRSHLLQAQNSNISLLRKST